MREHDEEHCGAARPQPNYRCCLAAQPRLPLAQYHAVHAHLLAGEDLVSYAVQSASARASVASKGQVSYAGRLDIIWDPRA
jgi:hypothetical protein